LNRSCDDAHHQCTYPQPKFDLDDLLYEGCDRDMIKNGVTLLPNPSIFKINEMTFGVNSVDVMRHLLKEDVCRTPQGVKKLAFTKRLPFHLWHQRSFYPLYPAGQKPSGQPEIAVDLGRAEQLHLGDKKPDCMILCSKLNHFATDCEDVLCINPGRLTKGVSGGTFARLVIQPYESQKLESQEDDLQLSNDMLSRTAVEVS
jgi:DNA polymerase alpha subunit B